MMKFRRGLSLGVTMLAMLLTVPAAAASLDTVKQGPKIGAHMAKSIGALDQGGQHRDFKSLARRRGLIILFSRSLDW